MGSRLNEEQQEICSRISGILADMSGEITVTDEPSEENVISGLMVGLLLHAAGEAENQTVGWTGRDIDFFAERLRHLRSIAELSDTMPAMYFEAETGAEAEGEYRTKLDRVGLELKSRMTEKVEAAIRSGQEAVVSPSP